MMQHTKYQDSRPCGFKQEDFSHVSLYKTIQLATLVTHHL